MARMDDRWAYPTPMGMQRQTGSAPKVRAVKSPSVSPAKDDAPAERDQTVAAPAIDQSHN